MRHPRRDAPDLPSTTNFFDLSRREEDSKRSFFSKTIQNEVF